MLVLVIFSSLYHNDYLLQGRQAVSIICKCSNYQIWRIPKLIFIRTEKLIVSSRSIPKLYQSVSVLILHSEHSCSSYIKSYKNVTTFDHKKLRAGLVHGLLSFDQKFIHVTCPPHSQVPRGWG